LLIPIALDYGPDNTSFTFALYPVYLRGMAYLSAKQSERAAAEFQRILDHRGVVGNEPIGALAHLGLARAYALSGDRAQAKAAYREFLDTGVRVSLFCRKSFRGLNRG
jgi:Tfp pilus assembly protein PilF